MIKDTQIESSSYKGINIGKYINIISRKTPCSTVLIINIMKRMKGSLESCLFRCHLAHLII